jgi:glycosyltransferase involved in cell wall biosynthesis
VDCLIFPSRGEGFGLPVREAMSTGIPVIAANWGGLEAPMSQSFNYPLNYNFIKCKDDGGENFGYYVDPSEEHLKEILADIYRSPEQLVVNGSKCANWVRENETYKNTAIRIVQEIKE